MANPAKRASSEQLLFHPFIGKACSKKDFARFARTLAKGTGSTDIGKVKGLDDFMFK